MNPSEADQSVPRRGIDLFRGKGAPGLFESGTMSAPELDPTDKTTLRQEGRRWSDLAEGNHDAVLFRGEGDDGFSLVRVWFAPYYVLPRHTHEADCLYYVAEGSVTLGSQLLEAGDGFFVPSGAPYGYEAGPEGATVLEFRARTSFGMKIASGQLDRLRRMYEMADEHGDDWAERRAQIAD